MNDTTVLSPADIDNKYDVGDLDTYFETLDLDIDTALFPGDNRISSLFVKMVEGYYLVIADYTIRTNANYCYITKKADIVYDIQNISKITTKDLTLNPKWFTKYEPFYTNLDYSLYYDDRITMHIKDVSKPIRFKIGLYNHRYCPHKMIKNNKHIGKYITYNNWTISYSPYYHIDRFRQGIALLRKLRLNYAVYNAWHYYWYDQRDDKGHSRSCKHVAKQLID